MTAERHDVHEIGVVTWGDVTIEVGTLAGKKLKWVLFGMSDEAGIRIAVPLNLAQAERLETLLRAARVHIQGGAP